MANVKVTAIKPVFYKNWCHPGESFDCDDKDAKKFEDDGKVKVEGKSTIIKQTKK